MPVDELQHELEATLRAREEAPELEPQLVERFVDRLEAEIDRRVDQRLAQRRYRSGGSVPLALPLGSLAFAIPLSGIAGGTAGIAGILVVWVMIAVINIAWATRR